MVPDQPVLEDRQPAQDAVPAADRPGNDERVKELEAALEQTRASEAQLVREFRNYRRHTEADLAQDASKARSQLLAELGDTVQALERAGQAGYSDPSAVREGVALVTRSLQQVFDRHGLSRIPTRGAAFDPRLHEAVLVERVQDVQRGTVVREVSPGFRAGDEVIRPAKVSVAA